MKNTAEHQVDSFKFLAVCIDMRSIQEFLSIQEACLEEILIGYVHEVEFTLVLCCSDERQSVG